MPKNEPTLKVERFRGVNNTARPAMMRPDPETNASWLTSALNIDIDDQMAVTRRPGFVSMPGLPGVTAAYATRDEGKLYVISNGQLLQVMSVDPLETIPLGAGMPEGDLHWCEAGNQVIFSGGIIEGGELRPFGIPTPDAPGMIPASGGLPAGRYMAACLFRDRWGREGGCAGVSEIELTTGGIQFELPVLAGHDTLLYVSAANGEQLYLLAETHGGGYSWTTGEPSAFALDESQIATFPPPEGHVLVFYDSRVWVAETHGNTSYIHPSRPFWYYLFPRDEYIAVPGEVRMLCTVSSDEGPALIIGTDRGIHAWIGDRLIQLADYGVLPGQPHVVFQGRCWFWTVRGFCAALPFAELTDHAYSVPPGGRASVGLREQDGRAMLIACTDTRGRAHNPRR